MKMLTCDARLHYLSFHKMVLNTIDTQPIYSLAFIILNLKVFSFLFTWLVLFIGRPCYFLSPEVPEPPCFGTDHTSPPILSFPRLCNHKIRYCEAISGSLLRTLKRCLYIAKKSTTPGKHPECKSSVTLAPSLGFSLPCLAGDWLWLSSPYPQNATHS